MVSSIADRCNPFRWFAHGLAPFLFAGALTASVFFQGFETLVFCLAQIFLYAWLVFALLSVGSAPVPGGLLVKLMALWVAWLAVTVWWSPVPYVSVFDVWWVGTFPLAFAVYLLTSGRRELWTWLALIALGLGGALAVTALVQFFVLGQPPRSTFININSHAALLNLIALPLAAGFLAAWIAPGPGRGQVASFGALFLLLVYAIALTKGRAAGVSFAVGLMLILVIAYRTAPRKALTTLLALTVVGFMLAGISAPGELEARYAELASPFQVSSMRVRFQIWEVAWKLLLDQPVWGIGLGLFSLVYPAHRLPGEDSAGFFVHNDFLQLWLEGGLPALLLLLVIVWVAAVRCARLLRDRRLAGVTRLEASGLCAGLLAIAVHSFVDFNFHILPILILAGVMLARLYDLSADVRPVAPLRWPQLGVSRPVYRLLVVLGALFPLLYFVSIGLAVYESDKGLALAGTGHVDKADQAFQRAYRFYPYADNVLVSHADLYRHVLTLLPANIEEERRLLYNRATDMLARAETLNPFRPLNHLVRARLYEQNPKYLGAEAGTRVEDAYRQALRLNPRFHPARLAYAKYLVGSGRQEAAHAVLEEGLHQYYIDYEGIVPYLVYAAKVRQAAGDVAGAEKLHARIKVALERSGWRAITAAEGPRPLELPSRPVMPGIK